MTAEELQKWNLTKADTKNKIGKLLNMECLSLLFKHNNLFKNAYK